MKILEWLLKNKKNKIENSNTNRQIKASDNKATYCKYYKNNICLLDNKKCHLKEINNKGFTFDCYKIVYDK